MGKSIIQQARGHGGPRYRVNKRNFKYRISYPALTGEGEIINLIHSPAHSAPLMKIKISNQIFYLPAFNGAFIGQKIILGGTNASVGNVLAVKDIPMGTRIYNIELNPGDGGRAIRTAGSSAVISKIKENSDAIIQFPSKKETAISGECRAVIGVIAGDGRKLKPFMKAGAMFYKMRARSRLWPRSSAVKMNSVDHPFGSGRGKRIKSKIAKRNAPPGKKVGHIRPRRTGKRK